MKVRGIIPGFHSGWDPAIEATGIELGVGVPCLSVRVFPSVLLEISAIFDHIRLNLLFKLAAHLLSSC